MSGSSNSAEHILQLAKQAKKAACELAAVNGEAKAAALAAMVEALQNARPVLVRANAADLEDTRNAGLHRKRLLVPKGHAASKIRFFPVMLTTAG